jgi:hypothetical protein
MFFQALDGLVPIGTVIDFNKRGGKLNKAGFWNRVGNEYVMYSPFINNNQFLLMKLDE